MGKRREESPLRKSAHPFQKASSWGVLGRAGTAKAEGQILPAVPSHESLPQGTQALQGLLGLRQLLL